MLPEARKSTASEEAKRCGGDMRPSEDSSDAYTSELEQELASSGCCNSPQVPPALRASSLQVVNYKEQQSSDDDSSSSEARGDADDTATPSSLSLSSSSTCFSHSDSFLASAENQGRYVLYVTHNPQGAGEEVDPIPTFFLLGLIEKPPEWESENLYFHTQDLDCSQDSS
jgi:hypothetical protein